MEIMEQPEGIEKERTQSFLICTEGTKASKQGVLDLPNNVVEGSARGFFTVVGDVLGFVMQDLVTLQMPYGSGEQNAVLLASDTYVLDYLKSTGQLTEEQSNRFMAAPMRSQLMNSTKEGTSYSVLLRVPHRFRKVKLEEPEIPTYISSLSMYG
ncbi:Ovostatin 2 [Saguinus oedipus]|uniref:Ovostatin 2 n=1 Tax=Saguinus oedipus TaxID=9490 RepID=A0ABQ9UXX8_SAGOE|nr:Ovostatin 2 [Saguinus oedipus]